MRILSLAELRADEVFSQALVMLKRGGVIAYPTESFYALGVTATDAGAVKRLFELKKRPAEKPLPLIVGTMNTLLSVVINVPDQAGDLIRKYWPGPLTLIFEAQDRIPPVLTGQTGKVAVRIPGESTALDLARYINVAITATSANPAGERPAVTAEEVADCFADTVELIIDGGQTPGGKPSTIVDVTLSPPKVLREGAIDLYNHDEPL
jgi:L-threonylcarbamoyladenylate synthase